MKTENATTSVYGNKFAYVLLQNSNLTIVCYLHLA
jgi:hypothetical protein